MKFCYLFIAYLISISAFAEQTVINDYDDARDNYFYDQLYIGTIGEYHFTAEYSAPYKTTLASREA